MGNICDAIGITRREPVKIENKSVNSSISAVSGSSSCETKSPVVDAASPSSSTPNNGSQTMNCVEMKIALAKKLSDQAAAAAAIEILTGPRIRLLPHQHTLFCERKQRVCSAVGQQQEMEVLVVEGLCSPTPPFSWIRIGDMDKFNNAVVNGTVDPVVDYTVLEQEHPFDERGVPAHSIFEYVLTREDVGHYIGVRYEDTPVVESTKNSKSNDADRNKKSNCKQETTNEQLLFLTDEMDGKRQSDGDDSAVAAPSNSLLEESAVSAAAADANAATVRLALESVITQMEGGEKASEVAADSQNLPSPPATQPQELSTGAVAEGLTEERKEDSVERPATAAVTEKQIKSIYRFLTLVSHGPVKPGPPRLTEFNIAGSMKVGTLAVAEASYIGGYEGATEYWWMRISPEGKRTQVTEPRRVPYPHLASCDTHLQSTTVLPVSSSSVVPPLAVAPSSATPETVTSIAKIASEVGVEEAGASTSSEAIVVDPRYYLLTADDVGCVLKVKCRPARSDGVEGEIFTSTSSEEVTSA